MKKTNAERQRRYIHRPKAHAAEVVTNAPGTAAEVAALRKEQLAQAKARIGELEAKLARRAWDDWRAGTAVKKAERAAAKAARAAAGPAQEGRGIACDWRPPLGQPSSNERREHTPYG